MVELTESIMENEERGQKSCHGWQQPLGYFAETQYQWISHCICMPQVWIDAIEFLKVGSKGQWANAVLYVVWVLQGLMQATPKCTMYVLFWIAWFWPNKLYIANALLNQ